MGRASEQQGQSDLSFDVEQGQLAAGSFSSEHQQRSDR
jgi:hypothetical protein